MRFTSVRHISLCFLVLTSWTTVATATVKLPAVIGDNMVLQRDQPVPIWGWADKGEEVTVTLTGQTLTAKTGDDGRWKVVLAKLEIGQPLEMTVQGSSGNVIIVKNILVGEVWLCSGQSNMAMRVPECNNAAEELAAADLPQIRLMSVPVRGTHEPQSDCQGQWTQCSPTTVTTFSATAYFFGRKLQKELNVPIGLINCSFGASSCEAWMKRSALEADPPYASMLKDWDERMQTFDVHKAEEAEQQYASWLKDVAAAKTAGKEPPAPLADRVYETMFVVPRRPSNNYNGMLLPIIPYAIRGAIWYQGETNVDRAYQYRQLFPLMIRTWRDDWAQGDFPFYFVQLASVMPVKEQPGDSATAELREAQTMTLRTPNTGMAVTIDIGDAKSSHPTNKQDVGDRLARWALAKTYGKDLVYSGPLYRGMENRDNQIVLHFDHLGTGLATKDGAALKGFSIAAADKRFVWADARIVGDTVVVSSSEVPNPVAVRYAWADNPVCNLYNSEGLPASPFRTDTWTGVTEKQ